MIMNEIKNYYVQLGIAIRIPMAFKEFCPANYKLKKLLPEKKAPSAEEELIQTIFEIYNALDEKVATLKPTGEYQCFAENFKPAFERIVEDLNYAAHKAAKAQDEIGKKEEEKFKDILSKQ